MHFTYKLTPISVRLIFEDNDYGLFNVTVFRKVIQDFKTKARDQKCVFPYFSTADSRFFPNTLVNFSDYLILAF